MIATINKVRMYNMYISNVCVYICMYVCVYAYMYACMYVRIYVSIIICLYVCMCAYNVCIIICIYACMYIQGTVCTYVRMFVRNIKGDYNSLTSDIFQIILDHFRYFYVMYMRTYVDTGVCTCMYTYVYVRIYICVHTYACVYIYMCLHIYIHLLENQPSSYTCLKCLKQLLLVVAEMIINFQK